VRDVLIAVVITLLLVGSPPSGSLAQPSTPARTPRQIADAASPSVVVIIMRDAAGRQVSLGSGFFVAPDVVATNAHVVKGAAKGIIRTVGTEKQYYILGTLAVDKPRDLALLKIGGIQAPSLALGSVKEVGVGDAVYVIGNPQGLEGTLSTGIISGIRRFEGNILFQISAPISKGRSGGPVLNGRGDVIGMAFLTLTTGQALNFAIPVSYLHALVSVQSLQSDSAGGTATLNSDTFGSSATAAANPTWFA